MMGGDVREGKRGGGEGFTHMSSDGHDFHCWTQESLDEWDQIFFHVWDIGKLSAPL